MVAGDADSSTATARAAHMGVQVLMSVFKSHAPARPVILNLCLARLTGSKEDQCLPYLCLLALLVREQGALVLNQMSCVKVRAPRYIWPRSALSSADDVFRWQRILGGVGCRHWWT